MFGAHIEGDAAIVRGFWGDHHFGSRRQLLVELSRAVERRQRDAFAATLDGAATSPIDLMVSFVDLVVGGGQGAFARLERFRRFRRFRATLDERCSEPPTLTPLRQVGGFRLQLTTARASAR